MNRQPDISARPLLIGGMHRSGTSLTASLFAAAGLDLGPELLGANASNPMGHFEDLGILQFHCRALAAQGLGYEGYTAGGRVSVPSILEPEADDLLAARMRRGEAWGWKEPRTTLFLDFWQDRLPDARHVFVFRSPWEVADSLFRRGDNTFALNPMFVLDVWTHYNRLIIDFVSRHPTRCLVFEISQVVNDPDRVFSAVRSQLGVPLARPADLYRSELFTHDRGLTHAAIVRAAAPDAWRTYQELVEIADSGTAAAAAGSRTLPAGECALVEWAKASRAESRAAQASREQAEREQAERERLERERAERKARRRPWAVVKRALDRASRAVVRWLKPDVATVPPALERERPAASPDLIPFPRLSTDSSVEQAA